MAKMNLPQCEVCKYYETCVEKEIDKGSLFCMCNFYVDGFVWKYYESHIDEFSMTMDELMESLG